MNESSDPQQMQFSPTDITRCIAVMQHLAQNSELLYHIPEADRIALLKAAGTISRPSRDEKKKNNKEKAKLLHQRRSIKDREARSGTGIRLARENPVFTAPAMITAQLRDTPAGASELATPRQCYICKEPYTRLHFFYDALCPACAELNYRKRFQSASLDGSIALITGSRLKIGYQATLMMLRAGAEVIATTRFPVDSALRFSREADFCDWSRRLHIFGLDLRHTPSVELFCSYVLTRYPRLDVIINNAAQTVRRPPGFYAHLLDNERTAFTGLPADAQALLGAYHDCILRLGGTSALLRTTDEKALPVAWNTAHPGIGIRQSARLSQIPYSYDSSASDNVLFPAGKLDADLQQVDMRTTNSWRYRLGEEEIPTAEMLEIQLVNAVAPFVLCNRLIPLMKRDFTGCKHIVNVSAMEGKFLRWKKGDRHPHTNMAKASLNMMTHTAAEGLKKYGIYMNAVDTGWVTDEDPAHLAQFRQEKHDFQPPIDIVDGAARVCDPFFDGILTGNHWCGKFLKDYFPIDW